MADTVKLSVNINKIALIRNSRPGNNPDLINVAMDCEAFGADGITIHPRPDERHIRYADIESLKKVVRTELNVEGNPTDKFLHEVIKSKPHQCTLVPDSPLALTSDKGWDTVTEKSFLSEIVQILHQHGIRVSLFIDPSTDMVEGAFQTGADRVELYTGHYANLFGSNPDEAITDHVAAAQHAQLLGLGVNAGHDLNLQNLNYYVDRIPNLLEVSIGHALVIDAMYYGLNNVIQMYRHKLKRQPL